MTWLRVDDKFPRHPKVAALTDREFRVWVRVLCYCAEYKTKGKLPDSARQEIAGLTNATVTRYVTLGLLDKDRKGACEVHDWRLYNPSDPTAAARMREHRRNARSNDAVTRSRARAGTRARPDPSPTPKDKTEPNRGLDNGPLHNPAVSDFDWDHILKPIPD